MLEQQQNPAIQRLEAWAATHYVDIAHDPAFDEIRAFLNPALNLPAWLERHYLGSRMTSEALADLRRLLEETTGTLVAEIGCAEEPVEESVIDEIENGPVLPAAGGPFDASTLSPELLTHPEYLRLQQQVADLQAQLQARESEDADSEAAWGGPNSTPLPGGASEDRLAVHIQAGGNVGSSAVERLVDGFKQSAPARTKSPTKKR